MKLNTLQCKNAKPKDKAYKLRDGDGMHLEVKPNGSKIWRYRFVLNGKESMYTLGELCDKPPARESDEDRMLRIAGGSLTLAEARDELRKARLLVQQGISPVAHRQARRIARLVDAQTTFESVALQWASLQRWADSTHAHNMGVLNRAVFPRIGSVPIRQITSPAILQLLQDISSQRGPKAALVARQLTRSVFEYAAELFLIDSNPVLRWKSALPAPPPEHKPALKPSEIGQLLRDVAAHGCRQETHIAFRLAWWALCRPNEAATARWQDMDLETGVWTIPAAQMKMKRDHTVFLPRQGVLALQSLKRLNGRSVYCFPKHGDSSSHMRRTTFNFMLRDLGWQGRFSPHAIRTTGSTLLHEMGYNSDWIERQLAHQDANAVRRAYNHARHEEDRARMMQHWADLLDAWEAGDASKVIPFPAATRVA
ncbi:MAG: tyrosine-type recombinase/integrase [Lautropia sp.]|nr:tyrosine-type recombinase/integrase [Lautropia sp.]